ncbi:hypothetical protein INT44_008489 [Umbelopsis vinacea]|uniref:Uncharacterized protein n=1 Tax=Umbelopsis vinacea TaxID=44442 RepID=A0A8H7UJX5_9FUNG|nr:hypothetical protein INT44_008489 [Umbelopsis vinacea]
MLHRFKLWTSATDIINACPIEAVRTINMNATTINIACNNCFKLVLSTARASWACDKCHKLLNPCSLWYVVRPLRQYTISKCSFLFSSAIKQFEGCMYGVKAVTMADTWSICETGSQITPSVPQAVDILVPWI